MYEYMSVCLNVCVLLCFLFVLAAGQDSTAVSLVIALDLDILAD